MQRKTFGKRSPVFLQSIQRNSRRGSIRSCGISLQGLSLQASRITPSDQRRPVLLSECCNGNPKFYHAMKTQRKPFQVELKRGTSRSAFISPSQESDVFRKAEAQLFRVTQSREMVSDNVSSSGTNPSRRILQAVEEPQAPLLPTSYEAPARRGRKPGSKNKPKLDALVGVDGFSPSLRLDDGLPKRRGRPPGSKNRVRPTDLPENARRPSLTSVGAQKHVSVGKGASILSDRDVVARRRGRPPGSKNKPRLSGTGTNVPAKIVTALKAAGVDVEADEVSISHAGRELGRVVPTTPEVGASVTDKSQSPQQGMRLRDRSKILRRYVLGTDSKAGERGYRRREA